MKRSTSSSDKCPKRVRNNPVIVLLDVLDSPLQMMLKNKFSLHAKEKREWLLAIDRKRGYMPIEYIGQVDAWAQLYSFQYERSHKEYLWGHGPRSPNDSLETCPIRHEIIPQLLVNHPLSIRINDKQKLSLILSLTDPALASSCLDAMLESKVGHIQLGGTTDFRFFSRASDSLKRDKQVMIRAVTLHPTIIHIADPSLFSHSDFIEECVQGVLSRIESVPDHLSCYHCSSFFDSMFIKGYETLNKNKDLVKRVVRTFRSIHKSLIHLVDNDIECMLILIKENSFFKSYLNSDLLNNMDFIKGMLEVEPYLLSLVHDSILFNEEFIEWAINRSLYHSMPEEIKINQKWAMMHLERGHSPHLVSSSLFADYSFVCECLRRRYPIASLIERDLSTRLPIISLLIEYSPDSLSLIAHNYISEETKQQVIRSMQMSDKQAISSLVSKHESCLVLCPNSLMRDENFMLKILVENPRSFKYMKRGNDIEFALLAIKTDPMLYQYCRGGAATDECIVRRVLAALAPRVCECENARDVVKQVIHNGGVSDLMMLVEYFSGYGPQPCILSLFRMSIKIGNIGHQLDHVMKVLSLRDASWSDLLRDGMTLAPFDLLGYDERYSENIEELKPLDDEKEKWNVESLIKMSTEELAKIIQSDYRMIRVLGHEIFNSVELFDAIMKMGMTPRSFIFDLMRLDSHDEDERDIVMRKILNLCHSIPLLSIFIVLNNNINEREMLLGCGYKKNPTKQDLKDRLECAYPSLVDTLHFQSILEKYND